MRPLIQIETALLVAMFAIGATGYFRLSARMDSLNTRVDGLGDSMNARMDSLNSKMDSLNTSVNARMDRLDAKIDAGIKELRDLILSQGR